jgi:hypothetical protein
MLPIWNSVLPEIGMSPSIDVSPAKISMAGPGSPRLT